MKMNFCLSNNENNIQCQVFGNDISDTSIVDNVVICCHGFAGSKDSSSTLSLAKQLGLEYQHTYVVSFDLPCIR